MAHEGFSFERNQVRGDVVYYRCCGFKRQGCDAKLIQRGSQTILKGTHRCTPRVAVSLDSTDASDTDGNPTSFATGYLQEWSTDMRLSPATIYERLLVAMRNSFGEQLYVVPTRKMAMREINKYRRDVLAKDISLVIHPPWCQLTCGLPMLRRHWYGDIDGEYHEALLWATDETLALLRWNGPVFIDGTFRIAPSPFIQCLIVMAYDQSTKLYVPCAYCLVTCKSEYIYCTFLHEMVVLLKYSWMPSMVVVDFEKGLIQACRYEFAGSRIIGCYFHMKQALYRKLVVAWRLNDKSNDSRQDRALDCCGCG